MAESVAKVIAKGMRTEGIKSVGWLDSWVLDYAGNLVTVRNPHPLNRMRAIFAHLDRSPLFEKRYRRSVDALGRERRVRLFYLREAA